MRHGGNKLHLQLGELNRSRHPHSLDGPNRCDGGDERNRQDPRHAENGAPRSGVDVRKLLGSLLVIDQLDLREILTNAVKGCDALGEIAIHSLLRAPFKNRSQHFVPDAQVSGPIAPEAAANVQLIPGSRIRQVRGNAFGYEMVRFPRLVCVFNMKITIGRT